MTTNPFIRSGLEHAKAVIESGLVDDLLELDTRASYRFQSGTRVWPVLRNPHRPRATWCAKPVTLKREAVISRSPVHIERGNRSMERKFSQFLKLNEEHHADYHVFLFDTPVKNNEGNLFIGFVTNMKMAR